MHHLNRREFLKNSAGASTLLAFSATVPGFLCRSAVAAAAQSQPRATALVVIQLSGGNDGLNTVIPYTDDVYHRARPTLRIPANQVLKLDARVGLHPQMAAFQRLCREGLGGVVQGVGYPNSNRNHEGALRDWHTARPKEAIAHAGWIGRALDQAWAPRTADVPGVFVGHIRTPFSLQAEKVVVPRVESLDHWRLAADPTTRSALEDQVSAAVQTSRSGAANPLLELVSLATADACASSQRVEAELRVSRGGSAGAYPQFRLAQTLRTIAQLMRAELGIRIYFAELGGGGIGGFDTHAGQAANHGALLHELSESIAAFIDDLRRDKLAERVLVMTFSEFGRTLTENGRRGTNHGAAAPVLLAGGALRGGVTGAHPSLTTLVEDAPLFHTDFRRLYATALERWLGFASQPVLGGRYDPLEGVVAAKA